MQELRVLIADDDRSWLYRLERVLSCECFYADNLADALRIIDEEARLDAGIFDRVLPATGERVEKLSFPVPHMNAGFVLAIAFHRRFPRSRTVVCSGAPVDTFDTERHFQRIIDDELCQFVSKSCSDPTEHVVAFLKGPPPSNRFSSPFLDGLLLEPNVFGLGVNLRSIIDRLVTFAKQRQQNKRIESDEE